MSKAEWFAVRKPSTGEIIATSVNQIVPPNSWTYKNVVPRPPPFLLQCWRGIWGRDYGRPCTQFRLMCIAHANQWAWHRKAHVNQWAWCRKHVTIITSVLEVLWTKCTPMSICAHKRNSCITCTDTRGYRMPSLEMEDREEWHFLTMEDR